MHPRTKIIISALVGAAVVVSVASASASSDRVTADAPAEATAASEFDFASRPAIDGADAALFSSINDMLDRNSALSPIEPVSDARAVGGPGRGIDGVVAPQVDGGLCYELAQHGTLGSGGCLDRFPESGRAGAHGVVADQFVLMGLVAGDVSSLSISLDGGATASIEIGDGAYTWTGSVDDAAPIAITTTRAGVEHHDEIDLVELLADTKQQPAPPIANVIG